MIVSCSLELAATGLSEVARLEQARTAFERACEQARPTVLALIGLLRTSVRTLHRQSLTQALELIELHVSIDNAAFFSKLESEQRRITSGIWDLSKDSRDLVLSVREPLGPVSRKAVDVLLHA